MSAASITRSGPHELQWDMPLACLRCHDRKVKCERQRPCKRCQKSGLECIPRARHVRPRPVRPNRPKDDLSERLERLESALHKLAGKDKGESSNQDIDLSKSTATEMEPPDPGLIADKFVGGTLWSSLATEVHSLRDILLNDEPDDGTQTEKDHEHHHSISSDASIYDFILAPPGSVFVAEGAFASLSGPSTTALFEIFCENVDPIFKIFHLPTLKSFVLDGTPYLGHNPDGHICQVLKAALWFSAISSIPKEQVLNLFGSPASKIMSSARRATDVAFSRAGVLGLPSLITLQALTLYVAALRSQDPGCRPWSLLAVGVRAAYELGLQRDTGGRSVIETQLRRRLWHQIRLLDIFCAADRGSQPMIGIGIDNTPLPANLNDEDFDETTTCLDEHESDSLTEMSFLYLTHDAVSVTHRLRSPGDGADCQAWQDRLDLAEHFEHRVQDVYLRRCDPSMSFHRLIYGVGKTMIASVKLRAVRLEQEQVAGAPPRVDTSSVLSIAVDCLEASEAVASGADTEKWRWMVWTQWQALAVALAGLCKISGNTELVSRAWFHIEAAYGRCRNHVADSENGMLWIPLSKLYRQAVACRDSRPGNGFNNALSSTSNIDTGGSLDINLIETFEAFPAFNGLSAMGQEWLPTIDLGNF